MKYLISLFVLLASLTCAAQKVAIKSDTLHKNEKAFLGLNNGVSILTFSVSGCIYLTDDLFIFHPKPFRKKRVESFNHMVKDLRLSYDSIIVAEKATFFGAGLKIKTKTTEYVFSGNNIRSRTTVALINRLMAEHKVKSFRSKL